MSSSAKILNMQTVVGTVLVLFGLIFGTILLFGLMNTTFEPNRTVLFKTVYFVFVATLLSILYMVNQDSLSTKTEYFLIIFSILLISVSLATFVGALKTVHDANYALDYGGPAQLEAQNLYYTQYADVLKNDIALINDANQKLSLEIENLTGKIINKTPIMVETIVTLPPETIYVEDTTPVIKRSYEDEYEEEDD